MIKLLFDRGVDALKILRGFVYGLLIP